MDSIQMKIAKTAARNWGQKEPTTLEESLGITWDSEVAAVEGMTKALNLDEEIVEKIVGTKDENGKWNRDGEIYTSDMISLEVSTQIQEAMNGKDVNKTVLKILSTIHNAWVRKNSSNFLKEGRNKERQFVSLQLLDWGEVESDLLFLKPILEGAGIQIDEEQLKQEHETEREEFLKENQIFSKEDLVKYLRRGSEVYPALRGLTTKSRESQSIDELLADKDVADKMADQVIGRLIRDILKSKNPKFKDTYWVETKSEIDLDSKGAKENGLHQYNQPMTYAEIIVREFLGENIRKGFVGRDYDRYENEVRSPIGYEWNHADNKKASLINKVKNESSYKITIGGTEIDSKLFWEVGINPEEIGLVEKQKVLITPKDMAKAAQVKGTTKGEVGAIKGIFTKLFNKDDRGKEEK